MKNLINKQKRESKIKSLFLIFNLLLSIFALSFFVNAQTQPLQDPDVPSLEISPESSTTTTTTTVTPSTSPNPVSPPNNPTIGGAVSPQTTQVPSSQPVPQQPATTQDQRRGFSDSFRSFAESSLVKNLAIFGGGGAVVGGVAGGEDGILWGTISGIAGGLTTTLLEPSLGGMGAGLAGLAVSALIFALTYKKKETRVVEFSCLPWQPPMGGQDCEKCNEFDECSEYVCKSLGQACQLVNPGSEDEKCVWANPHDVNSPIIQMKNVSEGLKFAPDPSIRPPATGVKITRNNNGCIKPFNAFEFTFTTDEPAQCKIDYTLTTGENAFEDMQFYAGGNTLFLENHTEKFSLPGPDAINAISPEIKNDGTYNFYVRCQDSNGNFNVNPFSVNFCVEKGPDLTPPEIVNTSIISGSPIKFNQSNVDLEVYVNEPSECKWSKENRDYDSMENSMDCDAQLWQINNQLSYTCRAKLTGLQDRKENIFYFRCKDQPNLPEADRNVNTQSFQFKLLGTQPLTILEVKPKGKILGSTDTISVTLEIRTDNGYKNGNSTCYYSLTDNEENYIKFFNTNSNIHTQRQDLVGGSYTYYFKCVDLGGNAAYNQTSFSVETDRLAPVVVRAYKESGELKIITHEEGECSYSLNSCNFDIEDGISMTTLNFINHNAEWRVDQNYYIRCKDRYDNQPNPNSCSIILRASQSSASSNQPIIVL